VNNQRHRKGAVGHAGWTWQADRERVQLMEQPAVVDAMPSLSDSYPITNAPETVPATTSLA
jgi:hypothetical protein